MAQIKLLISRPKGGPLAKIGQLFIRLAGRSAMTHCAVEIDGMVYEATVRGCLPPEPVVQWLNRQSAAKVAHLDLIDSLSATARANDLVGTGYDMGANISQALNKGDLANEQLLNCVEHTNEILAAGGAMIFHARAASGRSPGDIEALAQFDWMPLK
jgi:hypothetical protein